MNTELARDLIVTALLDIVPDADTAALTDSTDIRQALELDSLDFEQLVEALSSGAHFRIDETDYGRLRTMGSAVEFIAARGE